MSRDLLRTAADEVASTAEDVTERERRDRLTILADRLQSQAERETTPALGELDRIQIAIREIAGETDDESVRDRLDEAREEIFSFLETLEDRGMKQHGWSEE